MLAPDDTLRSELLALFARGVDQPLSDADFNALALRVFAYQFERNAAYAAYCRRRGATPATVVDWRGIPAVPTAAFKEIPLVAGDPAAARAVFRTSGTTRGPERRGAHYVLDLSLYRASLLPTFEAYVLPDGARLPMLSLIPSAADAPDSSLSWMVTALLEALGASGSECFATPGAGLDVGRLSRAVRGFEAAGQPIALLGTSLAFAHWLDELRAHGERFALPPGSRLMDTGGFKGHRREVPSEALRADYRDLLGIPETHVVNEYGMTELLSQYYDAALHDHTRGHARDARRKLGPPWLRAVVADPETLEPLPPGEVGILRHVDLANLDSVLAVQTEDLGREVEGGFLLLGRAAGAAPRGCSIAADLLIQAARAQASGP
ncbi:MAG: long-chain fatty acid--CoA ligase [Gemmatimonadetes bacterium]|nr:long-chain fatty acid--CoA ligase [Gemmatimonadota bacterium]